MRNVRPAGAPRDERDGDARMVKLSVVSPCFNEEAVIFDFVARAVAAAEAVTADYELVIVDDGSTDQTWSRLLALTEQWPRLKAIRLSRNHGHQLALHAGLVHCRGDRILVIDADLQDPPELLASMWARADEGVDVVYGQRKTRAGESWSKRLSAYLFYRLINSLVPVSIPVDTGDFRLMSRRVLEVLLAMPERHRFTRGMVAWVGFRQEPMLYERQPRHAGETKYPLRKMVRLAVDAVTAFSTRPLALATLLGLATAGFACLLVVYTVYAWWAEGTIPGWASIVSAMALFSAVQLFVLGIIGEYIGRCFEQLKGRPLFMVDQVVGGAAPAPATDDASEPADDSRGLAFVEPSPTRQSAPNQ